ncbi:MAG: hypothetical protein KDA86_06285 [Planctomycetaceae bacterium]|nr:hypothetical protein [Planctomycetaceae bacterium]
MDLRSFRFLHAADFRLDVPCMGVRDLTPELCRLFVNARYAAARHVFDTAIAHEVNFVVLAGGLLDPALPGLRGPLFLIEQFERLAQHGIKVYWAGATFLSIGRWPRQAPLPSNLRLFAKGAASQIHERNSRPVARLLLLDEDPVRPLSSKLFTIGIDPQCTTATRDAESAVDYWALGGQSQRDTHTFDGNIVHFPGSPQGRIPEEVGPHGCSLVTVDGAGDVSIQPVATDVVRWCQEAFRFCDHTPWTEVEQQFEERVDRLRHELTSTPTVEMAVINWTVTGSGLSMQRLMQPEMQRQLMSKLNTRFQNRVPAIWNLDLDAVIDARQLDDWQSESTSLGAFLREAAGMSESLSQGHGAENAPPFFNQPFRRKVTNEGIHQLRKALLTN